MQPMSVDPRVLRTLLAPEIRIVPGRALMARVASAGGGRGSLSIAGFLLEAELPDGVHAGDELRLVVRDVSAERVLLAISGQQDAPGPAASAAATPQPAPGAPQPAPGAPRPAAPAIAAWIPQPPVPLPGGGSVQVRERAGGGGAAVTGAHAVSLRYDAPALGPVDLRLALDPSSLALGVTVSPAALAPARAAAGELRAALSAELGRAVSVTIVARREPLDLYA